MKTQLVTVWLVGLAECETEVEANLLAALTKEKVIVEWRFV